MVWKSIIGLLTLVAVVVVPMLAIWYGALATRWGLRRYPKATAAMYLVVLVVVVGCALTFHHFFPRCTTSMWTLRTLCWP